jgi:sterol desaturase/sphingolipid hydroxylase (fatty acid hydroxylase superfamily)
MRCAPLSKDGFVPAKLVSVERLMLHKAGPLTVMSMLSDLISFTLVGVRDYFLYFGAAFVLLWLVFRPRIAHRKVQAKTRADAKQWFQEVKWSMIAQLGFVAGLLLFGAPDGNGLLLSLDTNNAAILVAASFAFILIDDAWFYWSHRWLHENKRAYKMFHRVHHRSIDTTPLTGLSFHPVESFIINIPLGVLPIFIGVQPNFFFWAIYISTLNNILGHNGFEWAPKWWDKVPALRLKTPSLHHNLHHEKSRGNYGLYFTYWDRWMGTEFKDYEARKVALRRRIASKGTSAGKMVDVATQERELVNG